MEAPPLIQGLLDPRAYPHRCGAIELRQTHSAWILLTGEYAYKIKKAVNFGFLDFSTLAKRRHYCEEEIRLNRRFAPRLYLDVVSIGATPGHPRVGAAGAALEYAVRMRQFAAGGLLSELAASRRLRPGHIDQLVRVVGEFHHGAERAAADSDYGAPEQVRRWVEDNFRQILPHLETDAQRRPILRLQRWCRDHHAQLIPLLRQRKVNGFVRECHGDLHLGNITLIGDRVTPFDCIEFNPELRWIDVISEIAFLLMDLAQRGQTSLAFRFLNGYLQFGGDYVGLGVLRYYFVYRALVRAKVALLRRQQADSEDRIARDTWRQYRQYVALAAAQLEARTPLLLITHGLSGSGKSTLAGALSEALGLIHLRSDIERKRLAGLGALENSHSPPGQGLYTPAGTQNTYQALAASAAHALDGGYPVCVDATFLQQAQRAGFYRLARQRKAVFIILHCSATPRQLRQRILARARQGGDPSEADLDVLAVQQRGCQALTEAELRHTLHVDSQTVTLETVRSALLARWEEPGAPGDARATEKR